MKKNNKSAFSIIIAIGLVLIMTLLVLYILEYIIPYSKNVKGVENSANAFYQAENSIEDGLYFLNKTRDNIITENSKPFILNTVDYKYNTISSGSVIPYNGEGNSEYDTAFNIIAPGNPIQLDIGNGLGINWDSTKIYFKVPDINKGATETLSGETIGIINWLLSSNNSTLNATGSLIKAEDITDGDEISMNNKQGIDLDGNETTFKKYYEDNCGAGKECSLKFSIINKLELYDGDSDEDNNIPVPYLEYKITTNKNIPLRYSRIKSYGKSYGFQKYLEVRVPQQTTNEAFDFAVFQ